ncbi:MAG: type II toxin-antitoxin system RelE/ParE family toxin [Bacteroidota bacterium]
MKKFKIVLYDDAISDFNKTLTYYRNISPAVAKKFHSAVNTSFNDLKKSPFYQIRYDNFRLKIVKKFLCLLHFIVDENTKTVFVYGIRNSHQNPDTSYFLNE